MNCSPAPDAALPILRRIAEVTRLPLLFKPNAGLPVMKADGTVSTEYSAKAFVDGIAPALDFVDYIGGCCGSAPSYIRELAERIGKN